MIATNFDPSLPLRYVRYGRMSTEGQNPRSPDQQFDEIERTKNRRGYANWRLVGEWRDDGISGRYMRKRPGFREMIESIRSGRLQVDAILVDTLERFGRAHEVETVREELRIKHGALVLTADSDFSDPTSVVGQVYGSVETFRARSAASQKAHDVMRGKLDCAALKRWPGGSPPCGYRLAIRQECRTRRNGREVESHHHVLEPDPEKTALPIKVYNIAYATGWGRMRIAKAINSDSTITAKFGRVSESLVGSIMTNPIYKGVLRFNKVRTDIQRDKRLVRKNDETEIVVVEEFCEPLVAAEIVDKVHADVEARSQKLLALRMAKSKSNGKQIKPLDPGLILVYPLTGMVRCGICGAAMRPSRSGAKSKRSASYYYYRCPCAGDGRCRNKIYLRGPWLWEVVIARLRDTLFPLGNQSMPALKLLIDEVRAEVQQKLRGEQDARPSLERELANIASKVKGWTATLSHDNLSPLVREQVEIEFAAALDRKQIIQDEIALLTSASGKIEEMLDAAVVVERLQRLEAVLASGPASDINVELSRHIDAIVVSPDGSVVMRTNRLGIFNGIPQILGRKREYDEPAESQPNGESAYAVRPRALTRRHTMVTTCEDPLADPEGATANLGLVLPEKWVDESIYMMPQLTSWAQDHAHEVAEARRRGGTLARIAEEFGVTPPTVRKALKIAQRQDATLAQLPKRVARQSWTRKNYRDVVARKAAGQSTAEIAAAVGKSETTIRQALLYAKRLSS